MAQTVFYSAIRPAIGQSVVDVIRQAARMGYILTVFNGWDNADLGMQSGPQKGQRRDEANSNMKMLMEIQDACAVDVDGQTDFPHIIQTNNIPDGYEVA